MCPPWGGQRQTLKFDKEGICLLPSWFVCFFYDKMEINVTARNLLEPPMRFLRKLWLNWLESQVQSVKCNQALHLGWVAGGLKKIWLEMALSTFFVKSFC